LKNNILIVGATGFIGYHLAKKCLKLGWEVTSISSKVPKKKRFLHKVKYLIVDISNKNILKKKLEKIKKKYNFIVNLGGYVDHSNTKKTYNSHYLGCKNIAETFKENNLTSFVQIGSSSEYGAKNSPQKENSKCKPKSIYGKSKLLATSYLINLFKKKNFPVVILRLYQVYGPKQDFNRFIPIVINGCLNNKKFDCSEGKQYRDFLYIDDVVQAIIFSLKKKTALGEIINIGSGHPKKIKVLIKKIKKLSRGGEPQYGKIKLRRDEILKIYPSISKASKILKWRPKIKFEIGLRKTIDSYKYGIQE